MEVRKQACTMIMLSDAAGPEMTTVTFTGNNGDTNTHTSGSKRHLKIHSLYRNYRYDKKDIPAMHAMQAM